jgi:hypothetical protein
VEWVHVQVELATEEVMVMETAEVEKNLLKQLTVAEDEEMAPLYLYVIRKLNIIKLSLHLRELELHHGDPQALMVEEQHIVVGDYLGGQPTVVYY